jgi:hypothetical protein
MKGIKLVVIFTWGSIVVERNFLQISLKIAIFIYIAIKLLKRNALMILKGVDLNIPNKMFMNST